MVNRFQSYDQLVHELPTQQEITKMKDFYKIFSKRLKLSSGMSYNRLLAGSTPLI